MGVSEMVLNVESEKYIYFLKEKEKKKKKIGKSF